MSVQSSATNVRERGASIWGGTPTVDGRVDVQEATPARGRSRRRRSDDAVQLRAQVLEAVREAVVAVGPDGTILHVNPPAEQLYGCRAEDAVGRPAAEVLTWDLPRGELSELLACVDGAEPWTGDIALRGVAAGTVTVTLSPVVVDGHVVAVAASAIDATERDAARAALLHLSMHDEVTGLANWRNLFDVVSAGLEQHDFAEGPLSVIRLDLDGLTLVNDAFGHVAADEAIGILAGTVAHAAHRGDLVARISTASFGVYCPHAADEAVAERYADRLREVVRRPRVVGMARLAFQASAGLATSIDGAERADELLQQADIALSRAKEQGTLDTCVYDDALRRQLLDQLELEARIHHTIEAQHVDLGYQPIVGLGHGRIVGAEALLRMTDDDGAPLNAFEVVEVAERYGLIEDLGLLILRTACTEAARWQREQPSRRISISVNVSASQLADDAFPSHVDAALADAGLDPDRLILEITESVLMADSERTIRQLARLKMSGVRISADDFGTGYSSLAYLKRFPLDAIKADLSFVAGLPDSPEDVVVVTAIIALAAAFNLEVVAEGVESPLQLDELQRLGCGYGQGYFWSRAVPAAEMRALLQEPSAVQAARTPLTVIDAYHPRLPVASETIRARRPRG